MGSMNLRAYLSANYIPHALTRSPLSFDLSLPKRWQRIEGNTWKEEAEIDDGLWVDSGWYWEDGILLKKKSS